MLASTRRMNHIARVLIRYRLHEYLPDEGAFRWLRRLARLHPAHYRRDNADASLGKRRDASDNLTAPELAVLLAYTKMWLYDHLLESPLPDAPYHQQNLRHYFPAQLAEKYGKYMGTHRLHREITSTWMTNDLVNRLGIAGTWRASQTSGSIPALVNHYTIAREVSGADALWRELESQDNRVPATLQAAMRLAKDNIETFHRAQRPPVIDLETRPGVRCQVITRPIERVGLYIPGGSAPLFSTVLMLAVPARLAGCHHIALCTPPPVADEILCAAALCGIDTIHPVGGAQAVIALAHGTASIAAVDKIFGPGNAYVASAKKHVFGQVGIDMIAGPSEILVLADGTTPPDWVAMDLFSQAEHDELAQSILLAPDESYMRQVHEAMQRLLPALPRAAIIAKSLAGRGAFIHTRSMQEACEIANRIAPEHLEISSREPHRWEPLLRHAGAIFLGAYTSESLGDYCAGPNHVLPTSGTARFSSPLSVYDFQKRSSLIEVSEAGAQKLGRIASVLAHGEGLQAHARAAQMRLE